MVDDLPFVSIFKIKCSNPEWKNMEWLLPQPHPPPLTAQAVDSSQIAWILDRINTKTLNLLTTQILSSTWTFVESSIITSV